jgi:hypothetical protein
MVLFWEPWCRWRIPHQHRQRQLTGRILGNSPKQIGDARCFIGGPRNEPGGHFGPDLV